MRIILTLDEVYEWYVEHCERIKSVCYQFTIPSFGEFCEIIKNQGGDIY